MYRSSRGNSSSLLHFHSLTVILLSTITLIGIFVIFHVTEVFHVLEGTDQAKSSNLDRIRLRSKTVSLLKDIKEQNRILSRLLEDPISLNELPKQNTLFNDDIKNYREHIESKTLIRKSNISKFEEIRKESNTVVVVDPYLPKPKEMLMVDEMDNNQSEIHPILFLNEKDYLSIPLSTMMSWYDEALGGGTCIKDFGYTLATRWRQEQKNYCHPLASIDSNLQLDSNITCYLIHQTSHAGSGDNLCVMNNVSVHLGLFTEESFTSPVVEEYVNTRHIKQPYIPFHHGFINAQCNLDRNLWEERYFPGWNADWTYRAIRTDGLTKEDMSCHDIIDHNILVVQRDTFANFFHDSEDFFNVFLAMAILEWPLQDTQIYLTDLYPEGPFWEMWSKVFGHGRPTMTAWDIKEKYKQPSFGKKTKTCFKNLAIGIYGPAAPMTVASRDTGCHRTALVRAYSDFVIRGLGIHEYSHYYLVKPRKKVKITFMARRASVEWPEKHFCNDTHSFFKCRYWDGFGIRTLGRMVSNEKDLIHSLKKLENETYINGAQVVVIDADYNLMTLEEQIRNDIDTDIMIGPHGAGLMHNIFMPDRAVLMELFIDGSSVNRHFHNLARWYGREYHELGESNPVNVNHIISQVRNIINSLNLNFY